MSCTLGKRFTKKRKYFKKQDPVLRGREYPENRGAEHPVETSVVRILDDSVREGRRNFVNLYLRGLHNGETQTHTRARILPKLVNTSTLRKVFFTLLHELPLHILILVWYIMVVRDSSVGVATRYRLGGPGIESWWCRDIPPSQLSLLSVLFYGTNKLNPITHMK